MIRMFKALPWWGFAGTALALTLAGLVGLWVSAQQARPNIETVASVAEAAPGTAMVVAAQLDMANSFRFVVADPQGPDRAVQVLALVEAADAPGAVQAAMLVGEARTAAFQAYLQERAQGAGPLGPQLPLEGIVMDRPDLTMQIGETLRASGVDVAPGFALMRPVIEGLPVGGVLTGFAARAALFVAMLGFIAAGVGYLRSRFGRRDGADEDLAGYEDEELPEPDEYTQSASDQAILSQAAARAGGYAEAHNWEDRAFENMAATIAAEEADALGEEAAEPRPEILTRLRARIGRKHIAVMVLAGIVVLKPWLVLTIVLLLVLALAVLILGVGPARLGAFGMGLFQRLAVARPEMADRMLDWAEAHADRIEWWLDKLPGGWTDGMNLPEADLVVRG